MDGTRRRKQPMTWQKYAIIAVSTILVVAAIVSVVFYFQPKIPFLGGKDDSSQAAPEPKPTSQDVSTDTMTRLDEGTVLNFGDSSKKPIYLFVDPADLSRGGPLVAGRPSKLLTAVQKNQISLRIYLAPSTPERSLGVDSMLKVSVCEIGNDTTKNHLPTLLTMVKSADKFKGTENLDQAKAIMGYTGDKKCMPDTKEVVNQTAANAKHFATQFELDPPRAIIANGGLVTDFANLDPAWVSRAIEGGTAKNFLKGN